MKKLTFVALLPLVLASCNLSGGVPTQFDISGNIGGAVPSGTIKIALVGGALSTDPIQNHNVKSGNFANSKFTLDLPDTPNAVLGIYEVIGYIDTNNNGSYDVGETRTKSKPANLLTYTSATQKWTLNGNTVIRENGKSVTRVNNYDLTW